MPERHISPALSAAFEPVVAATRHSREAWWIIGSAAMALHGVCVPDVADIDLMMSREDARHLLDVRGRPGAAGGDSGRFRSDIFGRLTGGLLPVDVMGGFHTRHGAAWVELRPVTREAVGLPSGTVYVPSLPELADITRSFGRAKDMARADLVDAFLREHPQTAP